MANFKNFVRGNWRMDNSDDLSRKYDIEAEVQIKAGGAVSAIVNGAVKKDGVLVATFTQQGQSGVPSFSPQDIEAEQAYEAYRAVLDFDAAVEAAAKGNEMFNA